MNTLLVAIVIIIIIFLLCSKQESYYNVFGQWVDGPFDEDVDGVDLSSPSYKLARNYGYNWWRHGIPYIPGYYRYWDWGNQYL